ncbi:ATP-binding cassette domain-containing protein [Paraburkholderia sp. RCC_158]|uniref:ATP-binding cassette domain-containing protein n=1 Tax=Paraburkholderia sp. RCC_158 TaxID=3239220 RepID=UPI0035240FD3
MERSSNVALSIQAVTKVFDGVKALDSVGFDVLAGEVHGLVGGNGAGKSTLMGVASGALIPELGRVEIVGRETAGNTEQARELGLAIVRQEPALMPDLTVAENLYVGVPKPLRPSLLAIAPWAETLLAQWSDDLTIRASDRISSLGSAERFIVEIVKALATKPKVLVLDEPTEHLMTADVERLFDRIRKAVDDGCAVVYISHRIREVRAISDRVTVLRDGKCEGTYHVSDLTEHDIVHLIVGGVLDREFPPKRAQLSAVKALELTSFRGLSFSSDSLCIESGEIVGLAGIDGNGQREFMRALAGLERSRGSVEVFGKKTRLRNSRSSVGAGILYLPGDRHREGIFADLSVRENFAVRSLSIDALRGFVGAKSERYRSLQAVGQFAVNTSSIETPIRKLSGGNQQKLVLASVLASKPKILLVDEPTQGVDIGARVEIYKVLRDATASGIAVVVVSSDAAELAGLCDRVLIFSRGQIVEELKDAQVLENNITSAMLTATTERKRSATGATGTFQWAAGGWAPIVTIAVVICALGMYTTHINDTYMSARSVSGILALTATLAIVAYGQQALMLVGGIDLSVGPLMGLIVVIQSFFLNDGSSIGHQSAGWLIVVSVAILVGIVNWILVDPLRLHPMVATLVTYMAIGAVSLLLRPTPGGLISDSIVDSISAQVGILPATAGIAVALGLFLEFALFKTSLGVAFRAVGSRVEAARMSGIRLHVTLFAAYVGCSLLAAVAAVPMMAQVGSGDPSAGVDYTLGSVAAAVIGGASLFGGRGSFVGALLGALLITQLNVVTSFLDLSDSWQSYLLGGMILVAVSFYSKCRQMAVAR